jgi:hypothetical protein
MRNIVFAVGAAMIIFATWSLGAGAAQSPPANRVERGRYLVSIAACHDCHSPKIDAQGTPDPKRLLSGRPMMTFPPVQGANEIRASLDLTAWAGPWGNSYGANLTPDKETGLGARYNETSFIKTIRTGVKPEGEQLAPPMPVAGLQEYDRRGSEIGLRVSHDAAAGEERRTGGAFCEAFPLGHHDYRHRAVRAERHQG